MEYNCQNFKDGNVLTAECLNHIEKGVQHVCETLDCLCGDGQPEKLSEYVQSAVESSTPKEVANALKGSASGEVVALNDVSPVEHEMSVSVRSKNLCSIGTVEVTTAKMLDIGTTLPPLKDGQVYIFSCLITSNDTDADTCMIGFYDDNETRLTAIILKRNERVYSGSDSFAGASKIYLYASNAYSPSVGDTATFADIQIEVANSGAAASAYAPYIDDLNTVTVRVSGKNLFDEQVQLGHYDDNTGLLNSLNFCLSSANPIKIHGVPKIYNNSVCNITAFYYDSQDNFLEKKSMAVGIGYDVPKSAYYMRFNILSSYGSIYKHDICVSFFKTGYEPYNGRIYPVSADGTVEGVKSIYPCTTLMTDTAGAVIDCNYNRDLNKAFLELQQAILALGV